MGLAKIAKVYCSIDESAALKTYVDLNIGAYLEIIDIHFDKAGGFTWNGEFEVYFYKDFRESLYDTQHKHIYGKTGNRWSCRPCCFSISIKKNEKVDADYSPLTNAGYGMRDSLYLETLDCQSNVKDGCYEDLQPLLEEYFWEYFRKRGTGSSLDDIELAIIAYIKFNKLEKAVSSYLQGIISAYSDSYLRNRGVIEELSSASGYNSSQKRYSICTGDEKFKQAAGMEKILFSMRELALDLSEKNTGRDKERSFLSKIDSLQEDFPHILQEFKWRISPRKTSNGIERMNADMPIWQQKSCLKSLGESKDKIGNGLITEDEKKKIKEYEKKIFTGDKESREDYNKLVDEVKRRYEFHCLGTIDILYNTFARAGLGDSPMERYRDERNDFPVKIKEWLKEAEKNFENCKNAWQGNLSPEAVYTQKQRFEDIIDFLLSVSTYVDKDGREREMTLLDRCKQAVLEKAESIEAMWDDAFKKKQYKLFAEDVKALKEIQYIIGVDCGNKAALLYGSEAAQRSTLFGENSGYVTACRFFAKIEEAFSPQDGLGTEERIDFQIKTSSLLEDIGHQLSKDNFALKLERVLGKINGTVIDGGLGKSLFGDAGIEEIFLQENGDIDIRKLAEVRKSILNAFEEIKDVPASDKKASGEVKYTLDDSLIQAAKKDDGMKNSLCEKLLVIEDQILATPSDRGAAYLATDSSGGGSFGEVSDFLSTDAYLDKLYAKINGGSPGTGSFGNTGYSDAGGKAAWHDGEAKNPGESQSPVKKILKIGLAVVIGLFLLRACGGIF